MLSLALSRVRLSLFVVYWQAVKCGRGARRSRATPVEGAVTPPSTVDVITPLFVTIFSIFPRLLEISFQSCAFLQMSRQDLEHIPEISGNCDADKFLLHFAVNGFPPTGGAEVSSQSTEPESNLLDLFVAACKDRTVTPHNAAASACHRLNKWGRGAHTAFRASWLKRAFAPLKKKKKGKKHSTRLYHLYIWIFLQMYESKYFLITCR